MSKPSLNRHLGLLGLIATGVCSMLGASIYIVPFMIQRHVPGIGPYVLYAFAVAAVPALLAALAYSFLSTAMPRAGGSYIFASRGLHPYLGFIASFSQWFGLSLVIGVVAYVTIPFLRDIAGLLQWSTIEFGLENGFVRVSLALTMIWIFVWINVRGAKSYEKTVIPLMFLMFLLGSIVIFTGWHFDHQSFADTLFNKTGKILAPNPGHSFDLKVFLSGSALLFASFIGFDSIAQAGGEAKNPSRNLPLAIVLTIVIVGSFYMLFTAAVYHTVPWHYIASEAQNKDLTAPGLFSHLLPPGFTIIIIAGAAVALINDLPAMLLSVSRLMYAWAEDGIFPGYITKIHHHYHTPYRAIIISGFIASIGVLGCQFAGNFFLGIDIMVMSMLVNFLLMCITLIAIDRINPKLSNKFTIGKSKGTRYFIGWCGTLVLLLFLIIHCWKDLSADTEVWYFRSTPIWLIVMSAATVIYFFKMSQLKKSGIDIRKRFNDLP